MKRRCFHVMNRINGVLERPIRLDTLDEARLVSWQRALRLRLPIRECPPWETFENMNARDGIYVVHLAEDESGEQPPASTFEAWRQPPP